VLDNGQLTGGFPAVVDCGGSERSLAQAVRVAAPGRTVHMVGMPGVTTIDLTPGWQREGALRGGYAYDQHDDRTQDFATAIELVRDLDLGRLVSATYPLARFEDAIDHAANAGARGAVKIAFDLRADRRRRPSPPRPPWRRPARAPAADADPERTRPEEPASRPAPVSASTSTGRPRRA